MQVGHRPRVERCGSVRRRPRRSATLRVRPRV